MKLNWFEKILLKNKKWLISNKGKLFILSTMIFCSFTLVLPFRNNITDWFGGFGGRVILFVFGLFTGIIAFIIWIKIKRKVENHENYNENLSSHQTENLQEYENIRTQFTLHNIKNAVINANNYMDILRKGKMDLTIATENIQVCLDRIDEILEVFKDSDYAQKRTEFRLEELFTTFQMLYHSTMIRRDIQFEVIYQNDVVKSQIVNQSFYDMF